MLRTRTTNRNNVGRVVAVLAAMLCLPVSALHAATLPVNATFTGGSNDGFAVTGGANGTWTFPTPDDVARLTLTGQDEATVSFASLEIEDDLENVPFNASVDITVNELSSTHGDLAVDIGMVLFGDSNLGGGYIVDFKPSTGLIRIAGLDDPAVYGAESFTFAVGETYTLSVAGTYAVPGVLDLTFTLTDPSSGDVFVTGSDPTPSVGAFVGPRIRTSSPGGGDFTYSGNIDFDNFSMAAVPEPSSVVLAAFAVSGLAMAEVRRRARRGRA